MSIKYSQDSYHKLTWYCVDALGNKEQEHVELDIVDTKPPVSNKNLGDPKHACTPEEQVMYYPGMPNPTDGCYFINQSTPITITCSDQDPHPVTHVKIYYKDWIVDDGEPTQWTVVNDDHVTIYKTGDSAHILKWYCVDELDNAEENIHTEYDIVDSVPPQGIKTIGEPKIECSTMEFIDDVESGADGWTATGLWHITEYRSHSPTHSWAYNKESDHNYDTGSANSGELISKDIILGDSPQLTFWSYENTEKLSPYDVREVYVNDGSGWVKVWYSTGPEDQWRQVTIDLSTYAGKTVKIKFRFDTIDSLFNNYEGWYVDDIEITNIKNCDYWVRGNVTTITLDCDDSWDDQVPHPVDHEKMCYRISFDNPQQPWLTSQYCSEFGGTMEGDYCCVDVSGSNQYVLTFMEDSLHDLEYYCEDVLGNKNQVDIEYFKVDSVPPTTTKTYGTPLVETDSGYPKWINSSTPITLTAVDGGDICAVGVDKIYWRNTVVDDFCCSEEEDCQESPSCTGTGNFQEYMGPFYKAEESCHLIEYYAVDKLGNVEPVKKQCVYVDNTPPVSSKTVGEPKHACLPNETLEGIADCWYITQNTEITLSCSDIGNHPVDQVKIYYKIDWKNESGDNWQEGQWQEDSNFVSIKYSQDSYHKLTWYCVDALGNKEQEHVELDIVDTKPPVSTKSFIGTAIPCSQLPCAVSGDCDYYINQSTKIELTCIDQEPHPVNHVKIYYRYKVDEGSWTEWTEYTEPIQYGEDSQHTLEWYCVDELGNTEETHVEYDRVDTTPPETIKNVGQPNWNDGYWVTSQTPITLTSLDKEVACAAGPWKLYYRISWDKNCDGDFNDWGEQGLWKSVVVNNTTCELKKTLYLEGECLHQIEWYAKDILGNTEQIHVQQHMVDNTPPHVLILKPVDGWYSSGEDIPIVAEAKDLNNANGPCEQGCNNCGGLGASCAVGIENGAQCYAYLLDMQFLNNNPDKMFNMSKWNKYDLITEGTLLYNAAAKECQGYATIPNTEIPDGIYILVVGVEDSLHNKANSFDEIKLAIKQRCGQDPYDLCEPECVDDVLQDIILSWNLPKIGIDNHAPIVTIISPEAGSLFGGEQVYVEANVTDSQDGQITSTITSGTPCYINLGGVSLGTVPYNNELRKCYGIIMIPQDKDFPQGEQELTVRIADNAGNIGEGTIIVKVDTVKPTLQIITPANNQFVKETQQIKFTATDENLDTSAVKVSTDNGQTWNSVTGGPSIFTYDWDTTQETDGMAYGIIAKATDLAGNTGYSEMVIVIVDNGAPEGVYILNPIKNEIVSGTITLKALATDYVSGVQNVKIYVNPNGWSCDATLVSGTWQCDFDSTLLPDGQHSVYAVATDNLGHQTTSASVPFIIDNEAPSIPSPFGHISSEGDYGYDRDGIVTWYWGPSSDAGAGVDHYVLELNGEYIVVYGTPNPEGWITYTISDLFDAMYEARVKAIDKAGHESDWTNYDDVIVDKVKPSPVSISTSGNENPPYDTNGNYDVNWLGGTDSNFDRYELFENDMLVYSGSGNTINFASKPDGSYEYYVTAYDKAGWSTSSNKIKVIVDTQAPDIQITGSVPGIGFFIAVYSVSDPEPSSGIDRIVPESDGYALCSGTTPTGFCTVFLGTQLTLTVYDKAGNMDVAISGGKEKDIIPPKILTSAPSGVINYNDVVLYARTDEPAVCYYDTFDNVGTMDQMDTNDNIEHQANLGILRDGLYVYHIRCQDLSGNMMEDSKTVVFYIDTTGNYELVIPDYGHYWSVGWNTFWLPQLILDDICGDGGPYPVETVLSSLYEGENANFDIIWYFNGTDWLAFMPEYPEYSDLQYFNDQSSLPYYIHMLAEDRLEIDSSICGYDLGPEKPPL
ncbi:MAG: Ig-like domain-containing protein [Candidatus Aenigmatarchaeota archaeon]